MDSLDKVQQLYNCLAGLSDATETWRKKCHAEVAKIQDDKLREQCAETIDPWIDRVAGSIVATLKGAMTDIIDWLTNPLKGL